MHPKDEAGFTLIELVITAVVLATTFLAVFGMFDTIRMLNSRANNLTIATEAAQQQVERYRNLTYDDIPVGTVDTTSQLAGYPTLGAARSSSAAVTQADPAGLKRLVVTLNYADRGRTKTVAVTTLIASNGLNK